MNYEPDSLFFTQMSRFQRLYAKGLTMRLSPYDVQPGYLTILHYLWQRDGVTQKELTQFLDIEQATLSNTLKRMERDGLVLRTPNKKDRRRHLITLTEKGASLKKPVETAINDLRKLVNEGLTVNDRRYFKRIMRQMSEKLEDDQTEPLFVLLDEVTE
ncbi:MAG: MarR family transcriptional regulator [Pseudodesulfovibrio sp.]